MPLTLNLTKYRALAAMQLRDTAAIQRIGATGYETVAGCEAVPCSYAPQGALPQEGGSATQRRYIDDRYEVRLPVGTTVTKKSRILVNGLTFEVIQPLKKSWEVITTVVCQLVDA